METGKDERSFTWELVLGKSDRVDLLFICVRSNVPQRILDAVQGMGGFLREGVGDSVLILPTSFGPGFPGDALHSTEAAYREVRSILDLDASDVDDNEEAWYSLSVQQDKTGSIAYNPEIHADWDFSNLVFKGSMPPTSTVVDSLAKLLLQFQALERGVEAAQEVLLRTDFQSRDAVELQKRAIQQTRKSLLVALVSLDPRINCYEGFEFDFIARVRETWGMVQLQEVALSAVDACRDYLDDYESILMDEHRTQLARGQKRVRFVLTAITLAASLTALLTVIDFASADGPLQASDGVRIGIVVLLIGISIAFGWLAHRRGVE